MRRNLRSIIVELGACPHKLAGAYFTFAKSLNEKADLTFAKEKLELEMKKILVLRASLNVEFPFEVSAGIMAMKKLPYMRGADKSLTPFINYVMSAV